MGGALAETAAGAPPIARASIVCWTVGPDPAGASRLPEASGRGSLLVRMISTRDVSTTGAAGIVVLFAIDRIRSLNPCGTGTMVGGAVGALGAGAGAVAVSDIGHHEVEVPAPLNTEGGGA